ncbi:MAG TPA: hypothetical protein VKD26_13100, partial [Streptosporangiaceae bacterium]|nr:hypothetical protein [Streptosporangiaceae bacterium]
MFSAVPPAHRANCDSGAARAAGAVQDGAELAEHELAGQELAEQGVWLCGGSQLPGSLLAALSGQAAWADPDCLGEDAPPAQGRRSGPGVRAGRGVPATRGATTAPGAAAAQGVRAAPGAEAAQGAAAAHGAEIPQAVRAARGAAAAWGEMRVEAGFCQGGVLDGLGPGSALALLLPDAGDLAGLGDGELTGVLRAWRRLSSWAAAMEHAAVAALATRRIGETTAAGACASEAERFAAAEVAAALTLTRCAAEHLVGRALSLADLPGTSAALAAGVIDVPRALVIISGLVGLGTAVARRVEAQVLGKAAAQTTGELRKAVARAVVAADPAAAEARRAAAEKSARVERWAE